MPATPDNLIAIAQDALKDGLSRVEIYSSMTDWVSVDEIAERGEYGVLAIKTQGGGTVYMRGTAITAVRVVPPISAVTVV